MCLEDVAISTSILTRKSLLGSVADEASHHQSCVGAWAPKPFAAVDKLDPLAVVGKSNNAVGVLGERNDLVIFWFFDFCCVDVGAKVLVSKLLFSLMARGCKSQLLWRSIVPSFIFYHMKANSSLSTWLMEAMSLIGVWQPAAKTGTTSLVTLRQIVPNRFRTDSKQTQNRLRDF